MPLRPIDLAREHGLSTQAVRNYEEAGVLPPADRSAHGYRRYGERHAAALRAFLALLPGHGHPTATAIMRAANAGDLPEALRLIDGSHALLAEDRRTLDAVRTALDHLPPEPDAPGHPPAAATHIGPLAHRLGLRPATLRAWERAGLVTPSRTPAPATASTRPRRSASCSSPNSSAAAATAWPAPPTSCTACARPAPRKPSAPPWPPGRTASPPAAAPSSPARPPCTPTSRPRPDPGRGAAGPARRRTSTPPDRRSLELGYAPPRLVTTPFDMVSGTAERAKASGSAVSGSRAKAVRSARRPGAMRPVWSGSPAARAAWVV